MSDFNGGALSGARKKAPFKKPDRSIFASGSKPFRRKTDGDTSSAHDGGGQRRGGGADTSRGPFRPSRPSFAKSGDSSSSRPFKNRGEGGGERRDFRGPPPQGDSEFRGRNSGSGGPSDSRGPRSSGNFRGPPREFSDTRSPRGSSDFRGPRQSDSRGPRDSTHFRGPPGRPPARSSGGPAMRGAPWTARPPRKFSSDRPRDDRNSGDEFQKPQRSEWTFKSKAAQSVTAADFTDRGGQVSFETLHPADLDATKTTFASFSLPPKLLENLTALGFQTPTPIQTRAIPTALSERDVIGIAQTGTGKTGAFLIPLLTKLVLDPQATGLILLPTRELAEQVFKNALSMSRDLRGIPMALLIGGVAMYGQSRALSMNPRLIIATPGRLMDHMRSRKSLLSKMKFLVLDEADRMVDFGFAPQVLEILDSAPPEHQSLLFSATMPTSVQKFVQRLTKNALLIQVPREAINTPKIDEKSIQVEANKKNEALLDCVNTLEEKGSMLVFAKTQVRTEKIHSYLEDFGVSCEKIHGGRSQSQRKRSLERFRHGQARVLIATDVAARGIDVDHISLVVNFDMPQSPEDYVHRIGRTGRAGRTGIAMSFLTRDDRRMWTQIQRIMKIHSGGSRSFAGTDRPSAAPKV